VAGRHYRRRLPVGLLLRRKLRRVEADQFAALIAEQLQCLVVAVDDHIGEEHDGFRRVGKQGMELLFTLLECLIDPAADSKEGKGEDTGNDAQENGSRNDVAPDLLVLPEIIALLDPDIDGTDHLARGIGDRIVGSEIGFAEDNRFTAVRNLFDKKGLIGWTDQLRSDGPLALLVPDAGGYPGVAEENSRGPTEDGTDRVGQLVVVVQHHVAEKQGGPFHPEGSSLGSDELPECLDPLFLFGSGMAQPFFPDLFEKIPGHQREGSEDDDQGKQNGACLKFYLHVICPIRLLHGGSGDWYGVKGGLSAVLCGV